MDPSDDLDGAVFGESGEPCDTESMRTQTQSSGESGDETPNPSDDDEEGSDSASSEFASDDDERLRYTPDYLLTFQPHYKDLPPDPGRKLKEIVPRGGGGATPKSSRTAASPQ